MYFKTYLRKKAWAILKGPLSMKQAIQNISIGTIRSCQKPGNHLTWSYLENFQDLFAIFSFPVPAEEAGLKPSILGWWGNSSTPVLPRWPNIYFKSYLRKKTWAILKGPPSMKQTIQNISIGMIRTCRKPGNLLTCSYLANFWQLFAIFCLPVAAEGAGLKPST